MTLTKGCDLGTIRYWREIRAIWVSVDTKRALVLNKRTICISQEKKAFILLVKDKWQPEEGAHAFEPGMWAADTEGCEFKASLSYTVRPYRFKT